MEAEETILDNTESRRLTEKSVALVSGKVERAGASSKKLLSRVLTAITINWMDKRCKMGSETTRRRRRDTENGNNARE